MTTNEFLDSLSNTGKNIVSNYQKLYFKTKSFEVHLKECDASYTILNKPQKYEIYLSTTDNKYNKSLEHKFLHEFLHCVQNEENYPVIKPCDNKDLSFSLEFASSILDFDVESKLQSYGYSSTEELNYIYNLLCKLYKANNIQKFLTFKFNDRYNICILLQRIKCFNNSNMPLLLKIIKNKDLQTYKMYNILDEILTNYDYNTKNGIQDIFEELIIKLNLSSIVKIY